MTTEQQIRRIMRVTTAPRWTWRALLLGYLVLLAVQGCPLWSLLAILLTPIPVATDRVR